MITLIESIRFFAELLGYKIRGSISGGVASGGDWLELDFEHEKLPEFELRKQLNAEVHCIDFSQVDVHGNPISTYETVSKLDPHIYYRRSYKEKFRKLI